MDYMMQLFSHTLNLDSETIMLLIYRFVLIVGIASVLTKSPSIHHWLMSAHFANGMGKLKKKKRIGKASTEVDFCQVIGIVINRAWTDGSTQSDRQWRTPVYTGVTSNGLRYIDYGLIPFL